MAHVTVPSENSYVRYTSQTGTGPFAFTFTVFEKDDLEVRINGSALATSAWTIAWDTSDDGGYTGGSITLNSSLTASSTVDIVSVIQAVRGTDFSSGSISPTSLNTELDKLTAMVRDLQRDMARVPRVDLADTTADLGKLSDNASKVFAVNSSGTALEFATNSGTGGGGSGSGNVSNSGTPVNNQVAVWTNSTTIEGNSGLTWDGSTLAITGSITDDGVAVPTISSTDTLSNKTLASPVLTTPQINDTSSNQQYIFAPSELTADRTVTLPLLTGNDTFVFQAHSQTLTNKTIAFGSNTVSGTFAEFNTAVTDATLLSTSSTATLTNKTFDLGGTGNVLTGSTAEFNTALQSDSFAFLGATNTFTGANDFSGGSVKVPASATPTIAAQGDFALDTSVTNYAPGALRYHDGTNDMHVVAVAASVLSGTPTNGHVVTYDDTNDIFYLAAAPGAGGGVSGTGTNNAVAVWSGTGSLDFTSGFTFDGTSLTLPATMFMTEVAAAAVDVAGDGQIWVKNATPNELWFTTDAGDDIQITTGTTINALTASGTATLTNKTFDLGGTGNTLTGSKTEFNTALQSDTFVMGSDLGANVATFLATPSSANLAAAVTGESGTGALLFGTSPTIATPTLTLQDANGAAPTTDGQIKFDRTAETLEVGDGTGTKIFSHDAGTSTLSNKTINSDSNTLTLDLSEGTLTGTTAEFNTALSDGSFATLAGTETLTNKTLTTPTLTLKQSATPTPTAEGDIQWDTDNNRIVVGNGAGQTTFTSGGVSASGTPVNNQVAVWTGAATADGDANLTWDGSTLSVGGVVAAAAGSVSAAGISFASDPNTGLYLSTTDSLAIAAGGVQAARYLAGSSHVIAHSEVHAAITASATQTQGQGALLSSYNIVTTVTTTNDVVTLFAAFAGRHCFIANQGANTLQIYPGTGDDLGQGVNTSTTLAAGESICFFAADSTNWEILGRSSIAGGGLSASGTPANNQLAVWTGSGTAEGDANLTWDGTTLTVAGAAVIGTASGSAASPQLAVGADSDTGLYHPSGDALGITVGGVFGFYLAEASSQVTFRYNPHTGLTASATQTQGQGALLSSYNEVSTVTTTNDVVTLPSAFTGMWCTVINNGANTLQIFPASSDNLGAGVDTSTTLAAGDCITFFAIDGTNWETIASTASSGGGDALTTDPLSQFAATTSLQLKGVISDETGSGALVFATSPTLVTPILGTPTSGTLTNCTGLPVAGITDSTTAALGVGTIELGHASDTTISRVSAGQIAVEGTNVLMSGGALGTPSSATLTNATGLPVSGIADSTTAALGVGTLELGHATDTTLARASAGNVSVEGTLLKKVGTETIWVPARSMVARSTSGAASGSAETTTNKVMVETFDFDTAADEFVQFDVAFPKSWNNGTVTAQFYWSNASGTGTAAWAIQGMALADSDVLDTAFGTAVVTTDTVTTAGDLMVSAVSTAVTIAGTPGDNELVYFQVYRDVSADTLGVDARLHGVKIIYTTDAANDD